MYSKNTWLSRLTSSVLQGLLSWCLREEANVAFS